MKQWTHKEFVRVLRLNGFSYSRHNGDHAIYVNKNGRHVSIPHTLQCVIARRLIRENNLITNPKGKI